MTYRFVISIALCAAISSVNTAAQQNCYCGGTQTTIPLPAPIVSAPSSCLSSSSSGLSSSSLSSSTSLTNSNAGSGSSNGVENSSSDISSVGAPTISLISGGPTFTGPAVPTVSLSGSPSINIPTPTVTFPSSSVPSFSLPTSIDCPKTPEPQVINHPDVNIPLPLPSDIPLGQYCACQKYAIKPTIVQCNK